MTAISVEDARPEDIPHLAGLIAELFNIEKDFSANRSHQESGLALLLQNPATAIIKVARTPTGEIIGMVSAQLVISTAQGTFSAWIEDMVVSSAHRGQGLGRLLLDAALDWAREHGATRAQLLVDTENQPALEFYRHLGWDATQLQARRILL